MSLLCVTCVRFRGQFLHVQVSAGLQDMSPEQLNTSGDLKTNSSDSWRPIPIYDDINGQQQATESIEPPNAEHGTCNGKYD